MTILYQGFLSLVDFSYSLSTIRGQVTYEKFIVAWAIHVGIKKNMFYVLKNPQTAARFEPAILESRGNTFPETTEAGNRSEIKYINVQRFSTQGFLKTDEITALPIHTVECGAGSIQCGVRIFEQCMGSVPVLHHDECG